MSNQPTGDFAGVCPYLGLADDADSHATYPTEAHRCYRLPNPTRIAANHQETFCLVTEHTTCPVYQGEGVPRPAAPDPGPTAAAAATGAAAAGGANRPRAASSPFGGGNRAPGGAKPGTRPATARRPGQLPSPRPRAGGISMPVITVGLFAAAIVIVLVALAIQQLAGDDDGGLSPADQVSANQTNTALAKTQAAQSGQTPRTATTQQPGTTQTPGAGQTPGTTATTGGSGDSTYTVQPGDNCSIIADAHGISLDQFLQLNPTINADCTNLQADQVVKVKP